MTSYKICLSHQEVRRKKNAWIREEKKRRGKKEDDFLEEKELSVERK